MRLVVQRVKRASVDVAGARVAEIGQGVLVLVGIAADDESVDLGRTASKLVDLRIFEDDAGKMNRSLREIRGKVLAVSQFTLCADTGKGRRPSFAGAAPPGIAAPLFESFVDAIREEGIDVETGRFGAKMAVELVNDGPVTLVIEVAPPSPVGYTALSGGP
jgi:D-tyrosyl-tRNA(Tyr) deacylase